MTKVLPVSTDDYSNQIKAQEKMHYFFSYNGLYGNLSIHLYISLYTHKVDSVRRLKSLILILQIYLYDLHGKLTNYNNYY